MSPAKASPRCRPNLSLSASPSTSPSPRLQLQLQARLSRASDNDDNVQRSNEPERFYAPRAFFTFEVAAAKREEGEEERGKERERLALLCFDTRLQSI